MPRSLDSSSEGRRIGSRYALDLPLRLIVQDPKTGEKHTYAGRTLNASSAGITFLLDQLVAISMAVDLEIIPPSPLQPLTIRGWLAWEDDSHPIYGLHFPEANEALSGLISHLADLAKAIAVPDRRASGSRRAAGTSGNISEGPGGIERRTLKSARATKVDFSMFDRRSALRIRTKLPVQVLSASGFSVPATLESLSEQGLSFRTEPMLEGNMPVKVAIPFDGPGLKILTVDLNWHFRFEDAHRYGGKFSALSREDLKAVRAYIGRMLRHPDSVADRRLRFTVTSELVSFKNREGKTIVGYHDHRAAPTYRRDPLILIPSAYAETKKDGLHTAYYLVSNGFQVIRYDNTNHTGESDGDILNITLDGFKRDLLATLDFCETTLGINQVGVAATSLSARTAIKAAAEDARITLLIGLVAAIDVQYTLSAVYCEDLIGTYKEGKLWGITNVLGCNTYLDAFLQDAIDHGYENLQTALEDVKKIHIPFVLLAAERDPWVRYEDVQKLMAACPSEDKELYVIPAMHQLKENPKAAQAAFRVIVSRALRYMTGRECKPLRVAEPSLRWLAAQNRIERQRMRLLSSFEKKENQEFWAQYLDQFHFINELPDYVGLLKTLHDGLRGLHPGERLLDAGCGNGTFGLWLLTSLALVAKNDPAVLATTRREPIQVYCIDYVSEALETAKANHEKLANQLFEKGYSPIVFHYQVADLENPLPFPNESFTKISSNLVISYLSNPVAVLREFARVTKPGGRIVVTTLKPYADTSEIYRNFVQSVPGVERVDQTRKLLNNAGDIKLKETEGHFNFFSEEELRRMAAESGLTKADISRAFADQANVLIGQV